MTKGIIDVHHHIIPDAYRLVLHEIGVDFSGGKQISQWKPEDSLAHMDALGVQKGICSISEPALYPMVSKDRQKARDLARCLNEYMAALKESYPGRFGGFAVLPMPDVEGSIREAEYAVKVLGLEGVGLLSNYQQAYLGNREFSELFDCLQELRAVTYVHPSVPVVHAASNGAEFLPYDYLLEFCFQTTRTAMNLLLSGTTTRCDQIQFIFSHMGGAVPYLGWRVNSCFSTTARGERPLLMSDPVWDSWSGLADVNLLEEMGKFYYDTALATHENALDAVERIAPGHTLFGSDSFYASQKKGEQFVADLERLLTPEQREQVFHKNAENLFR